MKRVEKQISLFLLVMLSLGLVGCSNKVTKEDVIRQYLVHSREISHTLVDTPEIIHFRPYRDGKKDGIVWWFRVTNNYNNRMERGDFGDREEYKATLVSDLRTVGVEEVADMGIYFRYIFESIDGRKIEFTITSSDFKN